MRSNGIAFIALVVALAAAGCHKKPTPIVTIPPPPPAPVLVPAPPTAPNAAPDPAPFPLPTPPPVATLDEANRAFNAASYDEAAREYENYLKLIHSAGQRDEALFRLGLTYALRPAPATDWAKAAAVFKQLSEEFPNSPLRATAYLLLALRSDLERASVDARQREQRIKQLTTELDRLKKIDANRTRRP